jgi:large subunit ribosomal protein L25
VKDMSEKVVINAVLREGRGKNDSGRLRAAGKVPMVVYGKGGDSVSVVATLADVAKLLRTEGGSKSTFTIAIEGGETSQVTFQDRQICPIKGKLKHADLVRV